MSDFTQVNDYSAKDVLATGNPEKLILGSDIDDELAAISTAITSKFDSNDLATQAQAEAETSNVVLLTPLRLANWADYNAGMVGDIQALADPGADRVLGWDESANATIGFSLSTGLTSSGTTLLIDAAVVPQLAGAPNTFTGTNYFRGTRFYDAGVTDYMDFTHNGTDMLVTFANTGELDITVTTFDFNGNLDLSGTVTSPNTSSSEVGYKGTPQNVQDVSYELVLTDAGKTIYKAAGGAGETITIPANASVAFPVGTIVRVVNNGGGTLSIAITTDTLTLAGTGTTGTRTLSDNGVAVLEKVASAEWFISGAGIS
ncbi:MAG: hypothetical protein A3E01_07140 [Gammaproteobacteria bacterium RIFCSPHIGHO2_12_FULL_63_22]|nr:MAG: hypothetical protein A3E01_07140 [Gammaproteobacteria bacterium RIFCSPHIGHO2_12_FULL_63_22]